MKVEGVNLPVGGISQRTITPAEKVEKDRKPEDLSLQEDEKLEQEVAPEEVLDRIKSLTEDGLYSVRFEMDKDAGDVVIKLVDSESGELLRQIPAEEILGLNKTLRDLRGLMVNTKG